MTEQNVPPHNPYPQGAAGPQAGGHQAPGAQGYPPPPAGAVTELSPADQRMWAMLAHLGGILFSFLAPLIVWLVQKDRGLYVAQQAREALNFQLTLVIAQVAAWVITVVTLGFGVILVFAVLLVGLVFAILAGLAANKGENYRYPLAIRMVN